MLFLVVAPRYGRGIVHTNEGRSGVGLHRSRIFIIAASSSCRCGRDDLRPVLASLLRTMRGLAPSL